MATAPRKFSQAWNGKNAEPLFPGYREYHARKKGFYQNIPFERSTFVRPRQKK